MPYSGKGSGIPADQIRRPNAPVRETQRRIGPAGTTADRFAGLSHADCVQAIIEDPSLLAALRRELRELAEALVEADAELQEHDPCSDVNPDYTETVALAKRILKEGSP